MFRQKKKGKDNAVQANSNHTMTWKDKTAKNSRVTRLRDSKQRTRSTLQKKSMYVIVILPDKPDYYVEDWENPEDVAEINEWWAENTVDFLNELQLIYGVLTDNNEEWKSLLEKAQKSEGLGYPKNVQYMWKATRDSKPKQLPIDVYIDHVIFWVNSQIENEEIFPTEEDVPFPKDFKNYLTKMFKRMFRIFAIMYSNPCLSGRKDIENTLDPCFKHFLYFSWKWGLLEAKETKCIDHIVGPLREKFQKDQKAYLCQKLPLED